MRDFEKTRWFKIAASLLVVAMPVLLCGFVHLDQQKAADQSRFVKSSGDFVLSYRVAFTLTEDAKAGVREYSFHMQPPNDVHKDVPYRASLTVPNHQGDVSETRERIYKTKADQKPVPDVPLTIGPGHYKNPNHL